MPVNARDISFIGLYIALLISAQFALSFAAGVEIVTALLVAYCYFFGLKRSLLTVNAFSLLRCVIFGFFPTVVILYMVYYNLFAVVFSLIGKAQKRALSPHKLIIVIAAVAIMTACFTLLDDIITPLFYKLDANTTKAYFAGSLPIMAMQTACAAATSAVLLPVMQKLFRRYRHDKPNIKQFYADADAAQDPAI